MVGEAMRPVQNVLAEMASRVERNEAATVEVAQTVVAHTEQIGGLASRVDALETARAQSSSAESSIPSEAGSLPKGLCISGLLRYFSLCTLRPWAGSRTETSAARSLSTVHQQNPR